MRFLLPLALLVVSAEAFHVPVPFPIQSGARTSMLPVLRCSLPSPSGEDANGNLERRQVLWKAAAAAAAVGVPTGAFAVDDKVVSKFATQAPPTDKDGQPFIQLESGASYREYKAGTGDAVVAQGSKVTIDLVGRLLNLNGVKFFSTKEKTDEFGEGVPLTFTIGAGEALPGLEQGMIGMKKGAIRKVIVPPALGYAAGNNLLPQPTEGPGQGRAALDSVLKNPRRDATLLFEVKVERIK